MAYTQILYHIVFRTKYSEKSIDLANASHLYRYIWGVIKNKKCVLYRINGMEDHIHLLSDLHPSVALADFIKDIKVASSLWMKKSGLFPQFRGWAVKYCALTYSYKQKHIIVNYIKRQREHHRKESFKAEVGRLLAENHIEKEEKWFWQDE